jgi:type II secretory pathway pseudopilin PulG
MQSVDREMKKYLNLLKNQKGDTIVEVMLALTVIGLSLGISFAIANRSTNVGLEARERSEALKLAESQLEYMKNDLSNIATYRDATPYCIVGGVKYAVSAGGSQCLGANRNSLYDISVIYTAASGANPENFESFISWGKLSTSGAGNNQVSLVYRP